MPSVFGSVVTGGQIEAAVVTVLKRWIGTYLSELERQTDREVGSLARPRSYTRTTSDLDAWPEQQLPAVFVLASGLDAEPERDSGDGKFSAWWRFGVGAVVAANTEENTRELAQIYAAAIRALLVQHPSLEGFADATDWVGEVYEEGSIPGRNRTLGVGLTQYRVKVSDVVTHGAGPLEPDPAGETTAPEDWPTVEDTIVSVENEPVTSDV
jgi:hypothetical protein